MVATDAAATTRPNGEGAPVRHVQPFASQADPRGRRRPCSRSPPKPTSGGRTPPRTDNHSGKCSVSTPPRTGGFGAHHGGPRWSAGRETGPDGVRPHQDRGPSNGRPIVIRKSHQYFRHRLDAEVGSNAITVGSRRARTSGSAGGFWVNVPAVARLLRSRTAYASGGATGRRPRGTHGDAQMGSAFAVEQPAAAATPPAAPAAGQRPAFSQARRRRGELKRRTSTIVLAGRLQLSAAPRGVDERPRWPSCLRAVRHVRLPSPSNVVGNFPRSESRAWRRAP